MRDNVCSVIISFVGFLHLILITHKEEFDVRHYEVAADIPELVSALMQVEEYILKYFESLLFVPTQFRFLCLIAASSILGDYYSAHIFFTVQRI